MVPESLTDEQFKENENIVVYSGGCDSTLVLYKVCERAKKLGKGVYVLWNVLHQRNTTWKNAHVIYS